MSATVIRQGRVIDPANGLDRVADLLMIDGAIAAVGPGVDAPAGAKVIDAKGRLVVPGLVDLRCRIAGQRDLDDAVRGGFTTLVATWDSNPPSGPIRVLRASPLTMGGQGEELGDVPDGAVCLSDGFTPVSRAGLMRRALQYARPLKAVLMVHAEDRSLSGRGVLGEGFEATRLGLLPVPTSAETAAVARDLALLEETGGRLHFAHLTCATSVRQVRDAQARGLEVTADVAAHHLCLCDEDARGYSPRARVWPPLRSSGERAALREAVASGVIAAVASDHTRPDPTEDLLQRELPFDEQVPGSAALPRVLSTVLGLGLPLPLAIALLTSGPARVLGLAAGTLGVGARADVLIIDEKAPGAVALFCRGLEVLSPLKERLE